MLLFLGEIDAPGKFIERVSGDAFEHGRLAFVAQGSIPLGAGVSGDRREEFRGSPALVLPKAGANFVVSGIRSFAIQPFQKIAELIRLRRRQSKRERDRAASAPARRLKCSATS